MKRSMTVTAALGAVLAGGAVQPTAHAESGTPAGAPDSVKVELTHPRSAVSDPGTTVMRNDVSGPRNLNARAPQASAAGWHSIFSDSHTPTQHWSTKDFVARSTGKIRIETRCSGENPYHVSLVRSSTHNTWWDTWDGCDGSWWVYSRTIPKGVAFYLKFSVSGHKDALWARVFEQN